MKCLNCVYYDDEYGECEVREDEEWCESFQEILSLDELDDLLEG